MQKLYSGNDSMFIRAEVPSKQGVVLGVDPQGGYMTSTRAEYRAALREGQIAEALGIIRDIPRVVVSFKTSATGDKTLSVAMPRNGQYHLKAGETVVVYADEFAEKPDHTKPPERAQARPFAVVDEDLGQEWSHPKPLPDPTDPHILYFEEISSSKLISKKILSEELPKKYPEHFENVNPDPLADLKARIRAGVGLGDLEGIVERNLPISLAGMQVLDEQGRVRYECTCQPGMGFR